MFSPGWGTWACLLTTRRPGSIVIFFYLELRRSRGKERTEASYGGGMFQIRSIYCGSGFATALPDFFFFLSFPLTTEKLKVQ